MDAVSEKVILNYNLFTGVTNPLELFCLQSSSEKVHVHQNNW